MHTTRYGLCKQGLCSELVGRGLDGIELQLNGLSGNPKPGARCHKRLCESSNAGLTDKSMFLLSQYPREAAIIRGAFLFFHHI